MFPVDAKGIVWENWPLDKVVCMYVCIHKAAHTYMELSNHHLHARDDEHTTLSYKQMHNI